MNDPSTSGDRPQSRRSAAVWVWACFALVLAIAFIVGDREERSEGPSSGPESAAASAEAELPPPEAGHERLGGTVHDPRGGVVPGAVVRARREGREESELSAEVDAEGRFALAEIPRGRWLVRATAPGFSETAELIDVPGPAVELTIAPVARIAGQVFGLDGDPTAADIVLAGSGVWPARTVRAGADGRFVLEDVPPGVYEVQARGADASAQPRRGLVVDAGGRAFLSFHFEPGETLVGRVIDAETDRPIVGAEIVVMEESLGVAPRVLRTAADGSLRIAGLRASSHRVTVHADGYVPVIAEEWTPGTPLRVALEPGATVSGIVVDARNRPIEGATLEVVGESTGNQPIALDGASVAFRERVFEAHAAVAPASMGTLEVTADVPAIPIDGPMGDGMGMTLVSGAVPAASAPVLAPFRAASGYVTGSDGAFRITGVPPGHVQLLARASTYAPGSSERVWVAPGGERDGVRIVLDPAGRIRGRVRDAHGDAVADVVIEHRSDGDPWPRTAYSDDQGAFVLEDVAGAITLRAISSARAPVQLRVDVAPGRTVDTTIDLPPTGPTIAGRTVDERGHAIARAQVRVESMAPGTTPPRVAFSDDLGAFSIDDAPPGPWRVTADHPDYAQGSPIDLESAPDRSAPLSLVLRAGVMVRGSVLDRMLGDGIAGAEVTLESDAVPPQVRTVRTDDAGSFVIPRALPGSYIATIVSAGHAGWSGPVEVAAARSGEVELDAIELAAGMTLEGEVVDALGQTLRGVEIAVEGDPATAVRTDPRGHFALGGLSEGSFVIRATHPAVGEVSREIRVHRSREPAPIVIRMPGRYDPDNAASERALRRGVAAEVIDDEAGVVVASVIPGSRAMQAGLREGDLVRAIDGEEIEAAEDAERLLRGADGVDAVLDLEREGEPFRLRVPRQAW